MHGRYQYQTRTWADFAERSTRDERVRDALEDRRRNAKHEPVWVMQAKSGTLKSRDNTGSLRHG